MKVTLLKHTIKAPTEYSYAYILITNSFSIENIIDAKRKGKKIVFWGSTPESYMYWMVLKEHGIEPDYVCDVYCEISFSNHGIQMRPYWELLEEQEKYYFIITIPKRIQIPGVMRQLFYAGVDEFGIVYSEWSKDFYSKDQHALQEAFYSSINEVFSQDSFFCNYVKLENLRRTALEGAGFWDVLYMSIYKLYKKKNKQIRYLEIGAGTGIMSFALKKLLGDSMLIDWFNVPVKENYWQENSTDHFKNLMLKYHIQQHLGYIEADDFPVPHKKYDCIVLAQVMEHFIYNPVPTFKKLANLLTNQGYIYVAVPYDHHFYNVRSWKEMPTYENLDDEERQRRVAINNYGHFHEYSYDQAVEVFDAAGLEVVYYRWNSPIHFFILRNPR